MGRSLYFSRYKAFGDNFSPSYCMPIAGGVRKTDGRDVVSSRKSVKIRLIWIHKINRIARYVHVVRGTTEERGRGQALGGGKDKGNGMR